MKRCPECGEEFGDSIDYCPRDGAKMVDPKEMDSDPLVGTAIQNKYLVLSKLGEGGMGSVYLVEHQGIGRRMAVKVLRKDLSADDHVAERFRREARAAVSVGNPHIIEITDYGELQDGRLFFVMELLEGENIDNLIEREAPFEVEIMRDIALQVCDGLQAAHDKGIIHRDIKPENLYLTKFKDDMLVKILDFGIAKSHNLDSSGTLTKTGIIFGTPNYMSPEQAKGEVVDKRSDIYSFGIILYQMATGRIPFSEDTAVQVLVRHISEEPIPPREKAPHSPSALAFNEIILKAIQKDPDSRYQSLNEMAREVEKAVGAPTKATRAEKAERQSSKTMPLKPTSTSKSPSNPSLSDTMDLEPPSRKGRLMILSGILLGLTLTLVLVLWLRHDTSVDSSGSGSALASTLARRDGGPTPGLAQRDAALPPQDVPPPQKDVAQQDQAPQPISQPVQIETTPKGAEIYVDDRLLGKTPLEVFLQPKEMELTIKRKGYQTEKRTILPGEVNQVSLTLAAVKRRVKRAKKPRRRGTKGSQKPKKTKGATTFKPLDEGFKNPFK